jgi:hypothetical protein
MVVSLYSLPIKGSTIILLNSGLRSTHPLGMDEVTDASCKYFFSPSLNVLKFNNEVIFVYVREA